MNRSDRYTIDGYSLEHVRNRNEPRVVDALRRLAPEQPGFCGCPLCLEDSYALALNSIGAHYVQRGSLILRKEPPAAEEIDGAVREAMARVTEHPKHGPGREADAGD